METSTLCANLQDIRELMWAICFNDGYAQNKKKKIYRFIYLYESRQRSILMAKKMKYQNALP